MVVLPAIQARDALLARLEALFRPDVLQGLCPSVKAPSVHLGIPVNEPPFYVAVDEVPDSVESSGAASMGHAEVSFDVHVWVQASMKDRERAAAALVSYIDVAVAAVLADQSLDMSVDNAFPSVSLAGVAADDSRRYLAAGCVDIHCTVGSSCPAKVMEVVNETNRNA